MTGNETMYWLAENYRIGVGVSTGIVVLMYVCISILVLLKSRKMGVNVSIGAMIPIWHFKYPIQGVLMNREPKIICKPPKKQIPFRKVKNR